VVPSLGAGRAGRAAGTDPFAEPEDSGAEEPVGPAPATPATQTAEGEQA
jgi:hypothetical protein